MRHEGFWEGEQNISEDCFEKTLTALDFLEGQMTWQRVLHWLQYARLSSTKQAQIRRMKSSFGDTSEQEPDC